jgi:cytochrome c biogenesis protein CcdA
MHRDRAHSDSILSGEWLDPKQRTADDVTGRIVAAILRGAMLSFRLIGAVVSVGLADSLNPSTVGPALFLATGPKRALRVLQFTAGVISVNLVVGLIVLIGPGRALIGLVPHPQRTVRHVIEIVGGGFLVICAVALWSGRRALARKELPMRGSGSGSALIAGASIAAVELPTALPYFAVIATIVASSASLPGEVGLLVAYNVAFVVPLLAIVGVVLLAGDRAGRLLEQGGAWIQRRWPVVLAGLLLLVGSGLIIIGGAGLVKN